MQYSTLSRQILLVGLTTVAASGCSLEANENSNLKIDSGTYITAGSKNRAPAVFWLGNCTGSAISHNTLIYAAHCAGGSRTNGSTLGQRSGRVCIKKTPDNPENPSAGACSTKLFVHPEYGGRNYRYDVAVGVFPDNTFQNYFPIQMNQPAIGSKILMVGYSSSNATNRQSGSKRWGYNKVTGFGRDDAITSNYGRTANNVAVSPGDSGGPLFSECKIAGVASRMSTGNGKRSLHTNLTINGTMTWLRNLVDSGGASICGLDGTNQSHCLASQTGGWDPALRNSDQTEQFPCAPASNEIPFQESPDISLRVANSSNNVLDIFIGTKVPNAAQASICTGRNICSGPELYLPLFSSIGSVTTFGPARWSVVNGMEVTMMIKSSQGTVIASRAVRLRKR